MAPHRRRVPSGHASSPQLLRRCGGPGRPVVWERQKPLVWGHPPHLPEGRPQAMAGGNRGLNLHLVWGRFGRAPSSGCPGGRVDDAVAPSVCGPASLSGPRAAPAGFRPGLFPGPRGSGGRCWTRGRSRQETGGSRRVRVRPDSGASPGTDLTQSRPPPPPPPSAKKQGLNPQHRASAHRALRPGTQGSGAALPQRKVQRGPCAFRPQEPDFKG